MNLGIMYELLEDVPMAKQEEVLDRVTRLIVERGFTTPAILFIDWHKPLNLFGSSLLLMLSPFVHAIFDTEDFRVFALLLERRDNVEKLLAKIEKYDPEYRAKVKEAQKQKKLEKLRKAQNV